MIFSDARSNDASQIHTDICIVGAGAAGIALARELSGSGLRVALIESGDITYRHRPQFLYLGRNTGKRNFSTVFSRFRLFGGSTTRWGGQCRPLDPIDFEPREAIPYSGWPFDFAHMEPYYRRAQDVCNLGPYDYDPASVTASHGMDAALVTRVYRFSYPANFSAAYRQELEQAPYIQVYLNANLVEVVLHEDTKQVQHLELSTLNGRRISLHAKAYVLACGGLENVRLLLASNRVMNTGIGNTHDLVGRFFMDHAYFFPGYFKAKSSNFKLDDFVIQDYAKAGCEQRSHLALSLDESTRYREGLNGASLYFVRRDKYKTLPEYMSRGGLVLNHLIDVLRHREAPSTELITDLAGLLGDFSNAAKTLGRQLGGFAHRQWVPGLRIALEMTPCRNSRVKLNDQKDRFGMPRIDADWQLNERDREGYYRLMEILRQELTKHDFGELVTHDQVDESGWPLAMTGGKHHMGTTRMHADPRQGVVDAHCRVHGIGNLFIAGSSVFPTGGYANPTLTIVALAIRLADHLKSSFKAGAFPA